MSRGVRRVLCAVGMSGVCILVLPSLAVGYVDYERWHRASARGADFQVDARWSAAPYSHLRLLGAKWTAAQVRVPATGEVITTETAQMDGREFWSIRVTPGP